MAIGSASLRTRRRRFAVVYIPVLALALVGLYLAVPDVQPSTAEVLSPQGLARPGFAVRAGQETSAVMRFKATQAASPADLAAARDVLTVRLSSYLPDDAQLSLAVEGDQLAVLAPASLPSSDFLAQASRIGRVELVDGGTEFLTIESIVKTGPQPIPDRGVYQAVLTSADFEAAEARLGDKGYPVLDFRLTPAGDARLAAHTSDLRGYYLCLVVDARVINCPVLRTPLRDRRGAMELRNGARLSDARALAAVLRSGPLPVAFQPIGNW